MIESGLFQYITQNAAVAAIAGNRAYGVLMPKGARMPAIVYQIVSTGTIESFAGRNKAEVMRMQFSSYANDYPKTRELSDAIRDALVPAADDAPDFYPLTLPDGSVVESARVHLDVDDPFEVGEGGFVFRALLDIELFVIPAN